jgi:hypothetical protein
LPFAKEFRGDYALFEGCAEFGAAKLQVTVEKTREGPPEGPVFFPRQDPRRIFQVSFRVLGMLNSELLALTF